MIKYITYLFTTTECWRIFQKVHPLQLKTLSAFKLNYLTKTQFCVKIIIFEASHKLEGQFH
jgi:hypothetical protein